MDHPQPSAVDLRVNRTESQLQRIPAAGQSVRAIQLFLCLLLCLRSLYLMQCSIGGLPKGVNDVRKRPTNAIHRWKTQTEEDYWSRLLWYGHCARIALGTRVACVRNYCEWDSRGPIQGNPGRIVGVGDDSMACRERARVFGCGSIPFWISPRQMEGRYGRAMTIARTSRSS
jgi:hypothetical protein